MIIFHSIKIFISSKSVIKILETRKITNQLTFYFPPEIVTDQEKREQGPTNESL